MSRIIKKRSMLIGPIILILTSLAISTLMTYYITLFFAPLWIVTTFLLGDIAFWILNAIVFIVVIIGLNYLLNMINTPGGRSAR
jgi:hypothetical protein